MFKTTRIRCLIQKIHHRICYKHCKAFLSAFGYTQPNLAFRDSYAQPHRLKLHTTMSRTLEGSLVGIGNPLLDITVAVDENFLKKYDLEANNAIIAEEKHLPMFQEMVEHGHPEYVAGGATQNSIRVAQWILQVPNATTFFGCVGNDKEGEILRREGLDDGVNVHYQVDPKHPTGRCGAVITGENRSLVAHLGAANYLTLDHFKTPENRKLVEKGHVFYIGGFVFTVSPAVISHIANLACDNNKILVMNLSAPFLIPYYVDPKINILPLVDILFGNYDEATALCTKLNINTGDMKQMALEVSQLPKKNPTRSRVVVFTGGSDPTIVAQNGEVREYPIIKVTKEEIKDTNGCGDSFVGGFLSQLVQGKPLTESLRCGNYCANVVIKHWGCTFPKLPDFK